MRVDSTWDGFAGFSPTAPYNTELVNMTKAALAGGGGSFIQADIRSRAAVDAMAVVRTIGGISAIDFGIPGQNVAQIRELYAAAAAGASDPMALIRLISPLVQTISNLATQTLGQVPYVKWVVAVGQLIANIAELASDRPDLPPDTGLFPNEADNSARFGALKHRMREPDWSPIFMPCQDRPSWSSEEIIEVRGISGFLGNGIRIKALGAMEGQCDGEGLIPGLTEQDGGVYEYPYEMPPNPNSLTLGQGGWTEGPGGPKGGFGWPITPMNTTGTNLSLLRQGAAALWQRVMRPSPETFMVDTTGMANAWARYYQSLREFPRAGAPSLRHQGTVQSLAATLASSYTWDPDRQGLVITGLSRFGGVAFGPGRSAEGVDRIDVEVRPRTITNLNEDLDQIGGMEDVIHQMLLKLYKMQWYALSRYVVAYVSPSAPALRDSRLRERHQQMRTALLDHPAICSVDLDMIRDDYRSAAQEAKERMKCFLGPGDFTIGEPPERVALDSIPEPEGAQGGPPGLPESIPEPIRQRNPWPYVAAGVGVAGATAASYYYWEDLTRWAKRARRRLPGGRR